MPPINVKGKGTKLTVGGRVYEVRNEVSIVRTGRLMQLEGMFDLPAAKTSEFKLTAELPLESREWKIGLIVGPSGSGKSSLAAHVWPLELVTGYEWPADKSVVDAFPQSLPIRVVAGFLSSVGFSSPPAWQRPYRVLSNGEQWRATLARSLAESSVRSTTSDGVSVVVMDEYTSVVDRTVAKIGSAAVAKAVRGTQCEGIRFVAVTCHHDVEEWLQPDWVFDTGTADAGFRWRALRRRPPIEIVVRTAARSEWSSFRRHHYLSESLNATARCYVAEVAGIPVAFGAVRSFPHASRPGWTGHRTVVLPDYQGVGIGNALSEFLGAVFRATGKPYRSTTSHPAMIAHRAKSPLWNMFRAPDLRLVSDKKKNLATSMFGGKRGLGKLGKGGLRSFGKVGARNEYDMAGATKRITASFEYVGPANRDAARALGVIT